MVFKEPNAKVLTKPPIPFKVCVRTLIAINPTFKPSNIKPLNFCNEDVAWSNAWVKFVPNILSTNSRRGFPKIIAATPAARTVKSSVNDFNKLPFKDSAISPKILFCSFESSSNPFNNASVSSSFKFNFFEISIMDFSSNSKVLGPTSYNS